jgi:hypothetical protein
MPNSYVVETYHGASQTFGHGPTFMDRFDTDRHAELRETNLFYPFASQQDWEIASWLLRSDISMAAIDDFLSLELVREHLFSIASLMLSHDHKGSTTSALVLHR